MQGKEITVTKLDIVDISFHSSIPCRRYFIIFCPQLCAYDGLPCIRISVVFFTNIAYLGAQMSSLSLKRHNWIYTSGHCSNLPRALVNI